MQAFLTAPQGTSVHHRPYLLFTETTKNQICGLAGSLLIVIRRSQLATMAVIVESSLSPVQSPLPL